MRAQHVVAGYEMGSESEPLHLRVEAYWKHYRALPLESAAGVFASDGYGFAHGIDLFGHVKRRNVDLTADYSWLAAERRWTAVLDRGKFVTPADGYWRPDFDIPQTAHLLTRIDLTRRLSTSAGWRLSSGKLDTPGRRRSFDSVRLRARVRTDELGTVAAIPAHRPDGQLSLADVRFAFGRVVCRRWQPVRTPQLFRIRLQRRFFAAPFDYQRDTARRLFRDYSYKVNQ